RQVLSSGGVQPTPAVSTRLRGTCDYMRQRRSEYDDYRQQQAQNGVHAVDFDIWLLHIRTMQPCCVQRFYPGVQK
ncbi:hypothetical protein R3P38DRAFT_2489060, partial [Favolaschia claudopus]